MTQMYEEGDWSFVEIELNGSCPCTEALPKASPRERALVDRKLRILRAAGIPPNPEKGTFAFEYLGRHLLEQHRLSVPLYLLKCKPGPWRLYFYVVPPKTKRLIEFLHAVSKKGWKRDPEDLNACRRRLDRIDAGTAGSRRFGDSV